MVDFERFIIAKNLFNDFEKDEGEVDLKFGKSKLQSLGHVSSLSNWNKNPGPLIQLIGWLKKSRIKSRI